MKRERPERAIPSPFEDTADDWILLPEKWTGEHAERRVKARRLIKDSETPYESSLLYDFAEAMACLDDWNVAALNGPPDRWDFRLLDIPTLCWISYVVTQSYTKAATIPKDFLLLWLYGQREPGTKRTTADMVGSSEPIA